MSLFTRMAESAALGGVLGTAIGILVGGAATTAVVVITAPVSIPAFDIRKIRSKFAAVSPHNYIETVWGVGYKWNG